MTVSARTSKGKRNHFGVHSPHEAKPDLIRRFEGKPGMGRHTNPTYAAMIASVDESVGRVLARLDELKLIENTRVIFSSDNGGVGGCGAGRRLEADRVLRDGPGGTLQREGADAAAAVTG